MINLRTHTVYAEMQERPNNVLDIKLVNVEGVTIFSDLVVGATIEKSKEKALVLLEEQAEKYIRVGKTL